MAGVTAYYNQVPRLRKIISRANITPSGGVNPVDTTDVALPNIRGQITIEVSSTANTFRWSIEVRGGFGDFPCDYTQDFYYQTNTAFASSGAIIVTSPVKNQIVVVTPAADGGGRRYVLNFVPVQSIGPTIRQTSVNTIGNNTLSVTLTKFVITTGF